MRVEMMQAKIHRATVTDANLDYIGSITIDEDLMEKSGILNNQKVQVVNVTNGCRLETYAIPGEKNSGTVCLNGAAAHHAQRGDIVIIITYCSLDHEEAKTHNPTVIFVNSNNRAQP